MSKFFTKTSAFVFVCSSLLFGAEDKALSSIIVGIQEATPTAAIRKCVLDFSDQKATASSAARILTYLMVEKTTGTLDLTDIAYLTFEGIAAASRKTPRDFGRLALFFENHDAVYENMSQIIGSIEVASHDLSILRTVPSCTAFVQNTITTDLPKLLAILGASTEDQADITLLTTVFTPMFAQLLNKTYTGTMNAAAAFDAVAQEHAPVVGCGCFGRSKAAKK